jgi:hypothetical protein
MPSKSLPLHCITHDDYATVWTWNRTLDEDETTLKICLDNFKVERCYLLVTHVTSHAKTLEHATWEGA